MATVRQRVQNLEVRTGTADELEVVIQYVKNWRGNGGPRGPADDDPALDALMLGRGHRKVGPARYACTPPGGPR